MSGRSPGGPPRGRFDTVYWRCTCGDRGTYPTAIPLKTDAALPDAKHQATCHGSVTTRVTSTHERAARESA